MTVTVSPGFRRPPGLRDADGMIGALGMLLPRLMTVSANCFFRLSKSNCMRTLGARINGRMPTLSAPAEPTSSERRKGTIAILRHGAVLGDRLKRLAVLRSQTFLPSLCDETTVPRECMVSQMETLSKSSVAEATCIDDKVECMDWAAQGECTKNSN